MWIWKRALHSQKTQEQAPAAVDEEVRKRTHRLEIQVMELTERLHSLEGRHESLSASTRGRLGGRPNKATGMGAFATPLPLNAPKR